MTGNSQNILKKVLVNHFVLYSPNQSLVIEKKLKKLF